MEIKKLEAGAMFVSDNVAVPYLLDEKQIQEIQKEYGKQHIQLLPKELSFYTFDLFYDSLSKRDELIEAFQKELVINDHGGHGSCDCSHSVQDSSVHSHSLHRSWLVSNP